MSSNTLVQADIWTVAQTEQGNVVFVRPKGSDTVVPIFIGQLETQAILIGLGRIEVTRPLTHDLFLSTINILGASLQRIEINDLHEGTYFARLIFLQNGTEIVVDARPSDSLALAVRAGVLIFIAESIVEEAGIPVDMIRETPDNVLSKGDIEDLSQKTILKADTVDEAELSFDPGSPERERLTVELEKAIAEEDYERAAIIRDQLNKI